MKYLKLITMMLFSLFLCWYLSANFLNDIIIYFINPESHEVLLDIWFYIFATIEAVILLTFTIALYKEYKSSSK
jgi:hypothetical protein